MERQITSQEADERFAELLRDVAAGESFIVTDHGRPVARVAPVEAQRAPAKNKLSDEEFAAFLRSQPRTVYAWKREDLYD